MSKYAQNELASMANHVLRAEAQGDDRALYLYTIMSAVTGLTIEQVKERIHRLARGEVVGGAFQ